MARIIVSKDLERATGQFYMLETDVNGDCQFVTSASVVAANETVTTLANNGDGTITHTSEDATVTNINVNEQTIALHLVNYNTVVVATTYEIFTVVPSWLNGYTLTSAYVSWGATAGTGTFTVNLPSISTYSDSISGEISIGAAVATGQIISFQSSAISESPEGLTVLLRFVP